jgi:hypothetical protein
VANVGQCVRAWPARACARLMAGAGVCAPYGWRGRVRSLWLARACALLMAGAGVCAPYGWRGRVRTLWLARAPCSKITSIIRDYNTYTTRGLSRERE